MITTAVLCKEMARVAPVMVQANAVKPAAGDESASQRRKRQKLAGGTGMAVGDEDTEAGAGAAAETVRWMSWSSQRRAFQCAVALCCFVWLMASTAVQHHIRHRPTVMCRCRVCAAPQAGLALGFVCSPDHPFSIIKFCGELHLVAKRVTWSSRHGREAWLSLLALPLPADAYRRVLVRLHDLVIPHLSNPLLLSDFLTASLDRGAPLLVTPRPNPWQHPCLQR